MLKQNFSDVVIPETSEAYAIESSLVWVTDEMNRTPLRIDTELFNSLWTDYTKRVNEATDECQLLTGDGEFKPNSPTDCANHYRKLGFEIGKTKTGRVSFPKDVLKSIARKGDKLAPVIIKAREAITRQSQLKTWKPYAEAGVVQCTWDQFGTPMARYTSENPNLQNRIDDIRRTVIADPGYAFVSLDLKQAEYRTWASLSQDPLLKAAFEGGKDFHTEMAKMLLAMVPGLNMWGDEPRKLGKTVNFAILYGMLPHVLAQDLGCSVEVAMEILKIYAENAPVATKYKERIVAEVRASGVVSTKYGRIRNMPEIQKAVWPELHDLAKTAWHHHNSGTAAELVKKKTVRMMTELRSNGFAYDDVKPAIQMHDEMILMVREEKLVDVTRIATDAWMQPEPGFIEMASDVRIGKTWQETQG